MSNIFEQIQELREQFNNLFEVDGDGLGQPAVDVPPSQNKIKKDRKTKNGKVEIVSVEDELFPYEGNKKEQYRQKIIATINDMIQGKATLEDLLQIVRQKKAPLKEAIELMEEMINEVSDKWKEQAQQKAYSNLRNAQIDKDNKVAAFKLGNPNVGKDDVKDAIKNVQKHAGRAAKLDNAIIKHTLAKMEGRIKPANEPLKEAIELMEEVINEVSLGKWKQAATNSTPGRKEEAEKAKKFVEKVWNDYDKKAKEHPEDEGDLYIKAVEDGMAAHKAIQRAKHADKVQYVAPDSKHSANKYLKAANKSKDREDDEGKAIWAKHVADMDPVKSRTKRFGRAFESLEEAIEVLEDLRSKIQAQPKEKRADLEAKFAKMKQKEGKSMSDRHKEMRKHMTKQEKGQEKTEERTEKALRNYIAARRDYMDNTPSMYEFESLEEAIQLLSELFDRPDLLDDIDTTLGSPVKKTFKKVITPKKGKKASCKENFDNSQEISYNIKEAIKIMKAAINEVSSDFTFPKIISKENEVKEIAKKRRGNNRPCRKEKVSR